MALCPLGSRCALLPWDSARAWVVCKRAPMAAIFEPAAWLGAVIGSGMGSKLQTRQFEFLKKSFEDGAWDESDVLVQDEGNLTSMMTDAWVGLARDGSKALKVEFTKNDENRIKMWLGRWSFGENGDASKDEMTSKKKSMDPPSKLCRDDMAAQGASKPEDLAFLELTLALARSVSESELEGWQYKGPVQLTLAGSKIKKWGLRTFDDILEDATKADDLAMVSAHVGTVVEVLSQSEHPFASAASARVLQYYQKACRNFNNQPTPTLFYLTQCRMLKVGRGIPELFDAEIANRAIQMAMATPAKAAMDHGVADKLSEIVIQMESLRHESRSTSGQLSGLMNRLTALERKEPDSEKERQSKLGLCFNCNKKGHLSADCPDK